MARGRGPRVGSTSRETSDISDFLAGPRVRVVDPLGLSDALISRLPARKILRWRVGHYNREIPKGYIETLQTGQSYLQDKDLDLFNTKLSLIIRGRLWDKNRWLAIWKMNLGAYNRLIDRDAYRYPDMVRIQLQDLMIPIHPGIPSKNEDGITFSGSGLRIDLGRLWHGKTIELSLDSNDDFQVIDVLGKRRMSQQKIMASCDPPSGLGVCVLSVPPGQLRKDLMVL